MDPVAPRTFAKNWWEGSRISLELESDENASDTSHKTTSQPYEHRAREELHNVRSERTPGRTVRFAASPSNDGASQRRKHKNTSNQEHTDGHNHATVRKDDGDKEPLGQLPRWIDAWTDNVRLLESLVEIQEAILVDDAIAANRTAPELAAFTLRQTEYPGGYDHMPSRFRRFVGRNKSDVMKVLNETILVRIKRLYIEILRPNDAKQAASS